MRVKDFVRDCVCFIGTRTSSGTFQPRATAFAVAVEEDGISFSYLVTAEHVVSRMKDSGQKLFLRTNTVDGKCVEDDITDWVWTFHPNNAQEATDVAVTAIQFLENEIINPIPIVGSRSIAGPRDVLEREGIGVGDEVTIVGLFRSHAGNERNVPIVRIGNIAMMTGERVKTNYCNETDAYLVEAMSIGGLSGSPVIVNLPAVRIIDKNITTLAGKKAYYLLGLMHGHFDIDLSQDTAVDPNQKASVGGINSGVGVVIPVEKIIETVNSPNFVQSREEYMTRAKRPPSNDTETSSNKPS
jgi:hypothetical protein